MIPMRDGTKLQTVIMRPIARAGEKLPILLRRTPYGIPDAAWDKIPDESSDLARDGYIWVFQNLRGRFKSEGEFRVSTKVDLDDPHAIDEATDAYDTIDWLIRNVPDNNGRVGMTGVSYSGLTAGMALLRPHPALKAVSPQAAPTDQFMNDDLHHYGALRLSYAFEYAALEQSEKHANAPFGFNKRDTYQWYLDLGPIHNGSRYFAKDLQVWEDVLAHPDYDAYWRDQNWVASINRTSVPTLTVAGFWDQEDPWGPWQLFRAAERSDPDNVNQIVAGPWFHGSWVRTKGDKIGAIPLGGVETGTQFRAQIEAAFFRYWLHGEGEKPAWNARIFETGSNRWHDYAHWPPAGAKAVKLYLHGDGSLDFAPPQAGGSQGSRSFLSDPANPVPYRPRPITATFTDESWKTWETVDQRFADHRPDVLTYTSAPLDRDIRIAGPVSATLTASTTGSDSDMIVKLIDVWPEDSKQEELRGYQFPIAMEVRRGRYLDSYTQPHPLRPGVARAWQMPLRDRDHVFRKGHRIMVQVQSSWFPLIDRNPQHFVPRIAYAKPDDFVKATQTIYSAPGKASFVTLPILNAAKEN
ncbi:CocE/NonD family hydrolase [Stakelama sp. CBK3Z-3]|uniref:CocE/NonD family hydrolase n=2 Tax=Stakelama flava TaxID=2860338 RepID=A0ABS6XPK4_9SPHN|nr:CocE/NonD family hydrolase [Stakelama flava]